MSKEAKDYYNEVDPENTYPDGEIEDWLFDKTDMIQFATDFANEQTQPLKDEIKELNKMRVENERLKGLNDEFEKHMISQNDLITKQQLKFRQTNKQLKEYKEVVKKVVREGYKLKAQHHNSKWKEALENAELLSKLNKD